LLIWIARFAELFGVRKPARFDPPAPAGDYDAAITSEHPDTPSLLAQYLKDNPEEPKLGGKPKETGPGEEDLPKT
jgi:hypothetical protein